MGSSESCTILLGGPCGAVIRRCMGGKYASCMRAADGRRMLNIKRIPNHKAEDSMITITHSMTTTAISPAIGSMV